MVLTFLHERNKRIEKAQAEARAEAFAEWSAWNRRREEAARRGESFAEPPPSLKGR